MPSPSRPLVLIAATAAAIGLAACGGETSSKATTATAAERQAFIAAGDDVCSDYNAVARKLRRDLTRERQEALGTGTLEPYAATLRTAADEAQKALTRFKALDVPAGDEAAIGKLTAGIADQQALMAKLAGAAQENDTTAFGKLNPQLLAVNAVVQRQARAYGFKQCGSRS